jgi:hypothetical protein
VRHVGCLKNSAAYEGWNWNELTQDWVQCQVSDVMMKQRCSKNTKFPLREITAAVNFLTYLLLKYRTRRQHPIPRRKTNTRSLTSLCFLGVRSGSGVL